MIQHKSYNELQQYIKSYRWSMTSDTSDEEVCLFRETALRDGAAATLKSCSMQPLCRRPRLPPWSEAARQRGRPGPAGVASIGNAASASWGLHAARCEGVVAPRLYLEQGSTNRARGPSKGLKRGP